ncbi:Uncharacterised protein [Mycobacteroides abscessus subsp. abscessus]|nr:Uncharacterised protein [Mycobacteroides abscessus subsp. abscessus]
MMPRTPSTTSAIFWLTVLSTSARPAWVIRSAVSSSTLARYASAVAPTQPAVRVAQSRCQSAATPANSCEIFAHEDEYAFTMSGLPASESSDLRNGSTCSSIQPISWPPR